MKKCFIILFSSFLISSNLAGQVSVHVNKAAADSIILERYNVYAVHDQNDLKIRDQVISGENRFRLTRDEMLQADKSFHEQYLKANLISYYQWHHLPELFPDSAALKKSEREYIKNMKRTMHEYVREEKNLIDHYDRYFFGYVSQRRERVVLMRFDPHLDLFRKLGKSVMAEGMGIYLFNINKNELTRANVWLDIR